MFHLSENLTLYDVFRLCRQHHIPQGCVLLEQTGDTFKELWPLGDQGIIKGSNFEEDEEPPEEGV